MRKSGMKLLKSGVKLLATTALTMPHKKHNRRCRRSPYSSTKMGQSCLRFEKTGDGA